MDYSAIENRLKEYREKKRNKLFRKQILAAIHIAASILMLYFGVSHGSYFTAYLSMPVLIFGYSFLLQSLK
jgi:nitrogen fixation/metabolism regulation signal transduction histidine kinase